MTNGLFEVLAHDDATEQERLSGNRAVIAAQTRVVDRFAKFVKNAANDEDRRARLGLLDDEIREVVAAVCAEYDAEDAERVYLAATAVLGGGHASDCGCGFCENKGKLPGSKRDEKSENDSIGEDADGDDSSNITSAVKTACECCEDCKDGKKCSCGKHKEGAADYPGHDYSVEGGEYADESSPEEQRSVGSDDETDKEAWHKARTAAYSVSMFHEADGFSFCECDCDGCKSANHCESDECISSKHSGNPGNSSGDKTSASVETGDTFVTESLDLGTSTNKDGVSDVGSPKIDKSQVPGGGGIPGEKGLSPIDVPSKQHPSETQDIHETPEYWLAPIGPSDTGKSIDAQSPLAPAEYAADNTTTWTGTEGQASPVTSKNSKWQILTT